MLSILLAGSFCGVDMTSKRLDVLVDDAANEGVEESMFERILAALSILCDTDLPSLCPILKLLFASNGFANVSLLSCCENAAFMLLLENTPIGAGDSRPGAKLALTLRESLLPMSTSRPRPSMFDLSAMIFRLTLLPACSFSKTSDNPPPANDAVAPVSAILALLLTARDGGDPKDPVRVLLVGRAGVRD